MLARQSNAYLASNVINAVTNAILAVLLLSSTLVCFVNRRRLVATGRKSRQFDNYFDEPAVY